MSKSKTSKPSPRRPKPKKCAPKTMTEIAMHSEPYERFEMLMRNQFLQGQEIERYRAEANALRIACTDLAAECDESRKQHLVATQRNVELTGELNAANAALQQYVTSYQTYRGRIVDADHGAAKREAQALKGANMRVGYGGS